jgi:hypothetical protein
LKPLGEQKKYMNQHTHNNLPRSVIHWVLGFAIAFLGVMNATNAGCPEGHERPCVIAGKPGHQVCAGQGWSPCVPDEPTTPPVPGEVHPKYYVLMVIYAPPGVEGGGSTRGGSNSSVTYGSESTAGSTVSTSSSFKRGTSVSVTAEGGFLGSGGSAGVSFDYSASTSNKQSLDITKSASTTITKPGPSRDGIDHDEDEIWLWLNPTIELSLTPTSATWGLGKNPQADIQKVYVGQLKGRSEIPNGVLDRFKAYGITAQEYPEILKADPPANGTIVVNRFQSLNTTFPYEPPYAPSEQPSTLTFKAEYKSTSSSEETYAWETSVGASVKGSLGFIALAKTEMKYEDKWTWTGSNTSSSSTSTSQSASVTVGGPAYGYSGPTDIAVYYDLIYNTFLFAPVDTTLQPLSLHGSVKNSSGKAAGGKEVGLVANGVKYRTFTNTKGEYRIFGKISGPLQLHAGGVKRQLSQLPADRKADIVLPIVKEESGRQQ